MRTKMACPKLTFSDHVANASTNSRWAYHNDFKNNNQRHNVIKDVTPHQRYRIGAKDICQKRAKVTRRPAGKNLYVGKHVTGFKGRNHGLTTRKVETDLDFILFSCHLSKNQGVTSSSSGD